VPSVAVVVPAPDVVSWMEPAGQPYLAATVDVAAVWMYPVHGAAPSVKFLAFARDWPVSAQLVQVAVPTTA